MCRQSNIHQYQILKTNESWLYLWACFENKWKVHFMMHVRFLGIKCTDDSFLCNKKKKKVLFLSTAMMWKLRNSGSDSQTSPDKTQCCYSPVKVYGLEGSKSFKFLWKWKFQHLKTVLAYTGMKVMWSRLIYRKLQETRKVLIWEGTLIHFRQRKKEF